MASSDRELASLGEAYAAARVELEYRAAHDGQPSPGHEWAPTWLLEDLAETIEAFVEAYLEGSPSPLDAWVWVESRIAERDA